MNKTIVLALMALTLPTVGHAFDFEDLSHPPPGLEGRGLVQNINHRPFPIRGPVRERIGTVERVPVVVHVHHHVVHR